MFVSPLIGIKTTAGPSLADQLVFDALPDEPRNAINRMFGVSEESVGPVTDALMDAYRRGWNDAIDEVELSRPGTPSDKEISQRLGRAA